MKQTTLFQNQVKVLNDSANDSDNKKKEETKPISTEPILKKVVYRRSINDSDQINGFDNSINDWVYPINFPIRDYQLQIVQECLYKNTLVCLPTGLGKTFIATVVMYNFYRWYPNGKLIFVAPTKPLVRQQMRACKETVPIKSSDIIEMTGNINVIARKDLWTYKRVFFLTAQILSNDLENKICPGSSIVYLVFDEAHKATGNHAYCQVIRFLTGERFNNRLFRVLGLSATPGNNIETIQDVIQNLLITHIELRTDECKDIQKYSHERLVEQIIVPLGTDVIETRDKMYKIVEPLIRRLVEAKVIKPLQPSSHSKFGLLQQKDQFKNNPSFSNGQFSSTYRFQLLTDFGVCITMYHAIELVQQHGLKPLLHFLSNSMAGASNKFPHVVQLMKNEKFMELYGYLQSFFNTQSFIGGHPKLKKLKELIWNHFQKKSQESGDSSGTSTRVIVFSQFRDSVLEILNMLTATLQSQDPSSANIHKLVRPIVLLGQQGRTTQKEQMAALAKFRTGEANVLVSTCIGEEGLDVGEVDLIVCFDAQKSPIRLVQRIGRTGRKREGKIVMLLSEGKEVNSYRVSINKKSKIHAAIFDGYKHLRFYPNSPRMIPMSKPNLQVNYQKFSLQTIPAPAAFKKSKKSNTNSLESFISNMTQCTKEKFQKIKITISPTTLTNKMFTIPYTDASTVSFVEHYRLTKYKTSWFEPQYYHTNIGKSRVTHDFLSIMKLGERHLRKQDNIIFHITGNRNIDIFEPLEVEDTLSLHSLSSLSLSLSDMSTNENTEVVNTDYDISFTVVNDKDCYLLRLSDNHEITDNGMNRQKVREMIKWLQSSNKPDLIEEFDQLEQEALWLMSDEEESAKSIELNIMDQGIGIEDSEKEDEHLQVLATNTSNNKLSTKFSTPFSRQKKQTHSIKSSCGLNNKFNNKSTYCTEFNFNTDLFSVTSQSPCVNSNEDFQPMSDDDLFGEDTGDNQMTIGDYIEDDDLFKCFDDDLLFSEEDSNNSEINLRKRKYTDL